VHPPSSGGTGPDSALASSSSRVRPRRAPTDGEIPPERFMVEREISVTVAEPSPHRTPKKWHGEVAFVHDARWLRGSFRPALNWRRACVWWSIWQLELRKRERSVIRGRQTRMCLLIANRWCWQISEYVDYMGSWCCTEYPRFGGPEKEEK